MNLNQSLERIQEADELLRCDMRHDHERFLKGLAWASLFSLLLWGAIFAVLGVL